jgi:hypothetical protein
LAYRDKPNITQKTRTNTINATNGISCLTSRSKTAQPKTPCTISQHNSSLAGPTRGKKDAPMPRHEPIELFVLDELQPSSLRILDVRNLRLDAKINYKT